jgi:hypothetical protein
MTIYWVPENHWTRVVPSKGPNRVFSLPLREDGNVQFPKRCIFFVIYNSRVMKKVHKPSDFEYKNS